MFMAPRPLTTASGTLRRVKSEGRAEICGEVLENDAHTQMPQRPRPFPLSSLPLPLPCLEAVQYVGAGGVEQQVPAFPFLTLPYPPPYLEVTQRLWAASVEQQVLAAQVEADVVHVLGD